MSFTMARRSDVSATASMEPRFRVSLYVLTYWVSLYVITYCGPFQTSLPPSSTGVDCVLESCAREVHHPVPRIPL